MSDRLNDNERALKEYISEYIQKNEESPTQRMMMKHISIKSVSGVALRLSTLARKGHIKRKNKGHARNITVISVDEPCPHCGK